MARIYIVEDDADIRTIEGIALRNAGHETEEFAEGVSFLARTQEEAPDLAVLDIMLPDTDGYELLRRIRQQSKTARLPVIMVTAKNLEIDMIRGLDMGADDYIRKPFSVMELITRIKAVLRRTENAQEAVRGDAQTMAVGQVTMDDERHVVTSGGRAVELTYKEYELLKLLMKNAGIVLKRETIMQRVWDTDFEGESRTVDMHIKTLRQKLGEGGKRIRTVRNVGYVME